MLQLEQAQLIAKIEKPLNLADSMKRSRSQSMLLLLEHKWWEPNGLLELSNVEMESVSYLLTRRLSLKLENLRTSNASSLLPFLPNHSPLWLTLWEKFETQQTHQWPWSLELPFATWPTRTRQILTPTTWGLRRVLRCYSLTSSLKSWKKGTQKELSVGMRSLLASIGYLELCSSHSMARNWEKLSPMTIISL